MFLFIVLSCVFFNNNVLIFQKTSYKTPILCEVGGCNITCVSYEKLTFGGGGPILGISAFLAIKGKTNTILRGYYLGQVGVIIWAKFVTI